MATEEVKGIVMNWLNGLAADFCHKGIVKLVQRLDKCPNRNGDYVETYTNIVSSSDIKIIWMNEVFFCL
jgi:hypothetical protein